MQSAPLLGVIVQGRCILPEPVTMASMTAAAAAAAAAENEVVYK